MGHVALQLAQAILDARAKANAALEAGKPKDPTVEELAFLQSQGQELMADETAYR